VGWGSLTTAYLPAFKGVILFAPALEYKKILGERYDFSEWKYQGSIKLVHEIWNRPVFWKWAYIQDLENHQNWSKKIPYPLLLIHGEADNNSGTYPMQSERYFNALKGLGATVRLVILPKESHGYRGKESILHLLWEQDQWLEKYVKNKDNISENGTN